MESLIDSLKNEKIVCCDKSDKIRIKKESPLLSGEGLFSFPLPVRKSRDKIEESVAGLDESVYHFVGEPDKDKKLVKILDITGKKGDTYMVNAWGRGTSLPETGTWITRVMTSDKNHVKSVTDAGENTVHYTWDMTRNLMTAFQDAKGNKISYTYDDMEHLLSVAQTVTVNGNRETVRNNYSYTDDNLTGIVHNGFAYAFNYDAFGNVSDVSVAGKQAVRYEYEDGNGNLLKVCYGNGAYIRYEYDKQNRIHMVYFKDAADSKEQDLYRYAYDKQGNIYAVKSYEVEKTYYLFYDFANAYYYHG